LVQYFVGCTKKTATDRLPFELLCGSRSASLTRLTALFCGAISSVTVALATLDGVADRLMGLRVAAV
jgi:hypothetical protein